jgi:tetratricopeptide (TPR) repeat protein
MMEYADTAMNMREIGQQLGAGFILEGGVQALGNRVRVNAQLIDAPADEHIWADSYDRELNAANIFDIQSELALAIASELQTTLSPTDRNVVTDVPTQNTEAYNAYLRGLNQYLTGSFSASNVRAVIASYEEAVALDPDFALAWARLSIVRSELGQVTDDADMREAALTALAQARELDPELLETELAWVVYLYRGLLEYEQALNALEAIGKTASLSVDTLLLTAWLQRRLGRFDDSYEALLSAQQLDPRSADVADSLVAAAVLTDDCDAAARHARTAFSLAPNRPDTRTHLAEYELECTGDAGRAGELLSDIDYEADWHLWIAREAAIVARDFERALVLADIPLPQVQGFALDPVFDQLFRAVVLRFLHRGDESAAILDAVAERLADVATDDELAGSQQYSAAKVWYHSMRGDAEATRHWVEEDKRRFAMETKGDRFWGSQRHIEYAEYLANAGLHDAAIEELRVMFEEPGGHRFRRADARPALAVLKDHPGYIELRERFADAR